MDLTSLPRYLGSYKSEGEEEEEEDIIDNSEIIKGRRYIAIIVLYSRIS